jgi:hypothetical protein
LIALLSPLVDPEEDDEDGTDLPLQKDDVEFKPFIPKLPEFKFWYYMTKALLISLILTSTRATDVPVFWPILLFYFIFLFVLTMKNRIMHMIKNKYVPINVGKKTYEN